MDGRFIVGVTITWFLLMAISVFASAPDVELSYPPNESATILTNLTLSCNVTSAPEGITNISLWGNFTGNWLLNQTYYYWLKDYEWRFNSPSNYSYNTTEITVGGGSAKVASTVKSYAQYHLNEASGLTVADSSGYGRTGEAINIEDSDWVAGKLNNALELDGVNEYVDLFHIAGFENDEPFSLGFWFKKNAGAQGTLISKMRSGGNYRGWDFGIKTNGGLYVYMVSNYGGNNFLMVETIELGYDDNAWHHAVFTYNGSPKANGCKIYVDSVEKTLNYNKDALTGTIVDEGTRTMIGTRNGTALYYVGIIDEVLIYDYKLSQQEVTFRYNNSNGTEDLGGVYYTTTPNISSVLGFEFRNMTEFTETATKPNNTDIKYQISNDSIWYYWDGSNWGESNGSFEQANNASVIDSNINTFKSGTFKFNAFLRTTDNSTRPILNNIAVNTTDYPLSVNATFNLYNMPNQTYLWNCHGANFENLSAWGIINWTFSIVTYIPTPFGIWVVSPESKIYTDPEINLSVYANKSVDSWKYSLNFGANNTFTPNTTIYPTSFEDNIIDVYAQNYTDWRHERVEFYYIPKTRLMFEDWDLLEPRIVITNKTCVGSTDNLEWITSVWKCIGDTCMWVNQTQLEYCEYGCDPVTCSCMPAPFMQHIWILVFVLGMAGIFGFLMKVR